MQKKPIVVDWLGGYLSCFLFFLLSSIVCLLATLGGYLWSFFFFLFFFSSHSPCSVHSHYSRLSCNNAKGGVRGGGAPGFQIFFGGGGEMGCGVSVGRLVTEKFLLLSNLGVCSFLSCSHLKHHIIIPFYVFLIYPHSIFPSCL